MSTCKICSQSLTVELDSDSFDEASGSAVGQASTAPDDLLLGCGCHFHWQCLLDESPQIASSLACPSCQNSVVSTAAGPTAATISSQPQVLVRYHNEGGIQENLDILPLITEEVYLQENPAARPARAFMVMCAEGDVTGIMELLQDLEENYDEGDMRPAEILRFQDPMDGLKTGLHIALEKRQEEVIWLLLWSASRLETAIFPENVPRSAEAMGATRETVTKGIDIRSLRDGQNRTAADIATVISPNLVEILRC